MIDRILALLAFLPVGLDRLVNTAFPGRRDRSVVVPVALGLLVLALVPGVQAGFELVASRTIPSEVIDRQVGGVTRLQVIGRAFDTGLPAGTDARGRPLRWLAIRDDAAQRSMLMARTPLSADALRTRSVVARVATDAPLASTAAERLGADAGRVAHGGRYLVEAPDASDPRAVDDPSQLGELADGTAVRVALRLTGAGVARCTLDATCDARALAGGRGRWLQLAVGPAGGQRLLVETDHPPTAIPVDLYGTQLTRAPAVADLVGAPAAEALFGWGRIFDIAILDHDPDLPIDRGWLGVVGLALAGMTLLLARRRAYPIFRHETPAGGWAQRPATAAIPGRATGRLALGDGPPTDAVDVPVTIEPASGSKPPVVVVMLPDGAQRLDVPVAATGVSGLEHGRLAWVTASRPALWLHWYRTDLRIAFRDRAARGAAATILAGVVAPPRALTPPPAAPPPPRPRPAVALEEPNPPPTFRRPRPRGAR